MHPPTPYPASARSRKKIQQDPHDTAFREITARANAVSRSEQDLSSMIKKAEEEVNGRRTNKTPTASRRYSVASKFAGPKADASNFISSATTALEAKAKVDKRASILGTVCGPPSKGVAAHTSVIASKGTTALPNKCIAVLPNKSTAVPPPHATTSANADKKRGRVLKSALYWLEQVKLAELMEKHAVAIGFFRLAIECEAEPVDLLREELIAYRKRYSLWSDGIQQVLLCYGVTEEVQESLFPQASATGISESLSPCTPAKDLGGVSTGGINDLANQTLEKEVNHSDEIPDNALLEEKVDANGVNEEVLHLDKAPMLGNVTGHIEAMDVDSLTREVVSYIMSSVDDDSNDSSCLKDELSSWPEDNVALVCPKQSRGALNASEVVDESAVFVQGNLSLTTADLDQAVSTGSMPSLDVWNTSTLSREVDSGRSDVQEEAVNALEKNENCISLAKNSGEQICLSMETDEDSGDNLISPQSKNSASQDASSSESEFHVAQKAGENHGESVRRSSIDGKSSCEASEPVQVVGKCETSFKKSQKIKNVASKGETEKSVALQGTGVLLSQANRKSRSSFDGNRGRNGREKGAPETDKQNDESPAVSKGQKGAAAAAVPKSRRLSTSTPRSSSKANVSSTEAGSRTRSKARMSQLTSGTDMETRQVGLPLKSPKAASLGSLATPTQGSASRPRDGYKEATLDNVAGLEMQNTDATGSIATPGSAGVRRSARLRPVGDTAVLTPRSVSTLRSVSTPRQRHGHLGTPSKAEN